MAEMGERAANYRVGMRPLNKRAIDPNDPRFVAITAAPTMVYNCIAWALGSRNQWWEPHSPGSIPEERGHWPAGLPHNRDPQTLRQLFQQEGFTDCENGELDPTVVKIALYRTRDEDGNYEWTHAARQLKSGLWTSKLGSSYEVTHRNPDDLDGALYGTVYAYLSKPRRGDDP